VEIVSSNYMIRKFRGIKEYTTDLGTNKTGEYRKEKLDGIGKDHGPGQVVIKIKDPFVKRYSIEYGDYITKMGKVGTLGFYVDNNYKPNEFKIFDETRIYEFIYENNSEDIRSYLSNLIEKILDKEIEPIETDINIEENIEFSIDKNLPQAEYLKQLKEMKQKMSDMNMNYTLAKD